MAQPRPWTLLGGLRKSIVDRWGKWYGKASFQLPSGRQVEQSFVGQHDWVIGFVVTGGCNVLVVTEFKPAVALVDDPLHNQGVVVGLPAGTAVSDKRLSPLQLLLARVKRETGYYQPKEVIRLTPFFPMTRNSPTRSHGFLLFGCTKGAAVTQRDEEEVEARAIPLQEWLCMVATTVVDGAAIGTTMQALPILVARDLITMETFHQACRTIAAHAQVVTNP